jgi:hypothetical protein
VASILKPFQVLNPRCSVPIGRLAIDWSHPLANGLLACYVPGAMGGINIANPGNGDIARDTAAAPFNGVGVEGAGLTTTVANSGMFAFAPVSFKGLGAYSLYYRAFVLGNSSASCSLLGMSYDNAGGSPYVLVEIGAAGGGTTAAPLSLGWNVAGTLVSDLAIIPAFTANTIASVGATFTNNGNVVGYSGGVNRGAAAWGSGLPASALTSQIEFNTYGGAATRFSNTTAFIGCIWSRALSDSEMAQLDADPYGFLIPAEAELPVVFSPSIAPPITKGGTLPFMGVG